MGGPPENSYGWKDSIIVPPNWDRNKCTQFAASLGSAPGVKPLLGCVTPTGLSHITLFYGNESADPAPVAKALAP
jgi:hypothetical protein